MISGKRISQTWLGGVIIAVLFIVYSLLLTSSATGEWFSYFLPATAAILALALFGAAIACKTKIPQLPMLSWVSIATAGVYFFLRAWFSPHFYGSIEDMLCMAFGLIFYILGIFIGSSRGSTRLLFAAILVFIGVNIVLLNDIALFNKDIAIGRPSQSLLLYPVGGNGTFGYENFTSQFLIGSSFFCIAYFIFAGIRSWPWFLLGILGCIAAFSISGARSVYPNMILGGSLCWLFLLLRSYSKTKIFVALSLFSLLILVGLTGEFIAILTQQSDKAATVSTLSNSADRFMLLSMIPKITESAPLLGHGAQAFPHLALPLMPFGIMPNMAHNEYAQAISDYGWIGLLLMVAVLATHLLSGGKIILRKEILPAQKAIYAAAFTAMAIMCFHASFDFIWHNAALTSSAGLCLGILSTGQVNQTKAGSRLNNWSLLALGAVLFAGLSAFSHLSFPVWKLSWEIASLPPLKKNEVRADHLELLSRAVSTAGDPKQADKLAHVILNTPELATEENCRKLITQLIKSLNLSPQDDMLKTDLGRAYDAVGEFGKAETLLYPYSHPPYYRGYPWKAIYLNHLTLWASANFGQDNATALSLLMEADRVYPLQNSFLKKSKNQSDFMQQLLLKKGVTPDDSWKKNRTPADFPTSYGPSLPGLVPSRS